MKTLDFAVLLSVMFVVLVLNSVVFGIGVALLTWAWNTLLAGVFSLPTISYVHGLALAILLGTLKSVITVVVNKEVS